MPLMPLVFSLACDNAYSNHTEACNKFLEASTKQTQIYQYETTQENNLTIKAKEEAGKTTEEVLVGVVYVYKADKTKTIKFNLPTLGLCDSANNQVTTNSYALNLKWNLW